MEPFEPTPGCGFTLTAIPVPHRSELSDNHALIIRGDKKSLLFMPDQIPGKKLWEKSWKFWIGLMRWR